MVPFIEEITVAGEIRPSINVRHYGVDMRPSMVH